ncbi:hypothetical protein GJ496_001065 [Pomphorhynchus laevis]|nr:hypothetical protein GJ496_001065 [Pomphorhynchus laevis]
MVTMLSCQCNQRLSQQRAYPIKNYITFYAYSNAGAAIFIVGFYTVPNYFVAFYGSTVQCKLMIYLIANFISNSSFILCVIAVHQIYLSFKIFVRINSQKQQKISYIGMITSLFASMLICIGPALQVKYENDDCIMHVPQMYFTRWLFYIVLPSFGIIGSTWASCWISIQLRTRKCTLDNKHRFISHSKRVQWTLALRTIFLSSIYIILGFWNDFVPRPPTNCTVTILVRNLANSCHSVLALSVYLQIGSKSRKPRGVKRIDDYVQLEIGCDCDGCNVWTLIKVKQVDRESLQQRPYYCGFCCAIPYTHKPAMSNHLSTEVTIGNDDLVECPSSTKRQPCRIWTNGRPHQYYRNRLNMQSSNSGTEPIITGSRSHMSVLTKQGCGSELQQSITTESLMNDSEGELERCGPWRRLSNSISSDCAHVESESNKRIRHMDFDRSCCVLFTNLSESASSV